MRAVGPGEPIASRSAKTILGAVIAVAVVAIGTERPSALGQQRQLPAGPRCRISGRITSGSTALPGVSVIVRADGAIKAATSSDVDGTYAISFVPNATYRISVELTGFAPVERSVLLGPPPCDQTIDLQLVLRDQTQQTSVATRESPSGLPADSNVPNQPRAAAGPAQGTGAAAQGRTGRGGQPGAAGFETLNVRADANGTATLDVPPDESLDAGALVPAGFSLQDAQLDAIAISGGRNATNLDRSLMNDRLQAINLGQFDPATGEFAPGLGPAGGQAFSGAGVPGFAAGGGNGPGGGGRGAPGGRGFAPGGRGGFVLGGRGGRPQNPYQGSATYTFGGSALDSPPYQLRPDVPVAQPGFVQNTFGGTFGGPLKIPRLYNDTNRRTNFQVNYTGAQSNHLFDQYATVPTEGMRAGDFSASSIALIDPDTGLAFPDNQIPATRIDPAAASLLQYIPAPNLPGTVQNYHTSTIARSSADALSLRLTQNFSPASGLTGRGGPGGRGCGIL